MIITHSNDKKSNKTASTVRRWRLRTLLFVLIVIIFIPISMLLIFQGYQDREQSLTEIKNQAEQLTEFFIDEQEHIIEHSQHLLEIIAQIPAVRNYDIEECNSFLKTIHKSHLQYSTIVAANREGIINCCAIPLKKSINVSDRNWFKRVRETGKFVIDEFIISRSANKASLPFAYPILDDKGNFQMAVGAAFDLSYYNQIFKKIPLPPESVVIITDKEENILHLYSDSTTEQWLGQPLAKVRGFSVPSDTKGSFTVEDIGKNERIYFFEHLSVGHPNNEICLFVGFSKKIIFYKADELMSINIFVLSITGLLSLSLGWYFGEKYIVTPINLLVQKIQKVSYQGKNLGDKEINISISENISYPNQELELLSKNFDDLVDRLSQREIKQNQAEEEIRTLNIELESRVKERTAELNESNKILEAINKELESFSYSVSHDLRAPLRGIDGWSLALLEDFEALLGKEGRRYVERIRAETQRMASLIDDLLKLSRLTRSEMNINLVNLSELAAQVAYTLNESIRETEPECRVELIIQPDMTAYADVGMIDIVLTNLMSNAFKFTSKVGNPKIEFGKLEQKENGREIFFVTDNGAGFDMQYAFKLFGAFQRLHKASEFPGTGIGLATVQRVIHKHGGRVWAEGEVNNGATFYFTLSSV
ncbi:MAG: hypothetical protein HQK73_03575 [Desulfamplus sp.]|nr:hypothetical protein [Desulfamplus sp.]